MPGIDNFTQRKIIGRHRCINQACDMMRRDVMCNEGCILWIRLSSVLSGRNSCHRLVYCDGMAEMENEVSGCYVHVGLYFQLSQLYVYPKR